MKDLIAKIEAAPEGSLDINEDIAEEYGWTFVPADNHFPAIWLDPNGDEKPLPDWSRSRDDAASLMPEGWRLSIELGIESALESDLSTVTAWNGKGGRKRITHFSVAKTEPLARVAAALKAREHETRTKRL